MKFLDNKGFIKNKSYRFVLPQPFGNFIRQFI